jgi:hypothetical protein
MDASRSMEVIVLIGTGAIGQAIARRIAPESIFSWQMCASPTPKRK